MFALSFRDKAPIAVTNQWCQSQFHSRKYCQVHRITGAISGYSPDIQIDMNRASAKHRTLAKKLAGAKAEGRRPSMTP